MTKKIEKVLLVLNKKPKIAPCNRENDLKIFGNTKNSRNQTSDLKVWPKKKNLGPISATDLLFHRHSVEIFQNPFIKEVFSVCRISYFKAF